MAFASSNISLKTPGVLEYRSIGVFTSPSFSMQSTVFKVNRLWFLSHLIYLSKPLEYWSIGVLEYSQVLRFLYTAQYSKEIDYAFCLIWYISQNPWSIGVSEYWSIQKSFVFYAKHNFQSKSTMTFVSSNISLKTCGVMQYRSIGVFTSPSFFMQSTIFKVNRLGLVNTPILRYSNTPGILRYILDETKSIVDLLWILCFA